VRFDSTDRVEPPTLCCGDTCWSKRRASCDLISHQSPDHRARSSLDKARVTRHGRADVSRSSSRVGFAGTAPCRTASAITPETMSDPSPGPRGRKEQPQLKSERVGNLPRVDSLRPASDHCDTGTGRVMVVGSGLGADVEYLANLRFDIIGFDISETDIDSPASAFPDPSALCHRRRSRSPGPMDTRF
jgi:hypothetical protein